MSAPDDKTLAERVAEGAQKLDDATRAKHAEDEAYEREQRKARDARFAIACRDPAIGWLRRLFGVGSGEVDAERAWIRALPFEVIRYEYLFRSMSPRHRWAIMLEFVHEPPDAALLQPLFGNVAPSVSVSTTSISSHRRAEPYAELELPTDFHAQDNRLAALRLLFHRVVDEVLRPLHAEYPLVSVEPRYERHTQMT